MGLIGHDNGNDKRASDLESISDLELELNPFADVLGKRSTESQFRSASFLKIEEVEQPRPRFDVFINSEKATHFGYYFQSMIYRWVRESFLVSERPRIHRAGFRSPYGVYLERSRHLASFPWIIHPYSNFLWVWSIFITLALVVTLARQPVLVAYMKDSLRDTDEIIYSIVFSFLFFVDIILNFRTGVVLEHNSRIILDPQLIGWQYLKGWFIVDVLSTIPYDVFLLLLTGTGKLEEHHVKILTYLRMLELLKICRISRVIRYCTRFQEAYIKNYWYIRIVNLHIVIFLVLHWMACLHYLVADMFNDDIVPKKPKSWVTQMNLWDEPVYLKYLNSVVRALSNMAGLGYGNEAPREPEDIVASIISIMIGATFYALFIGNLSSILVNQGISEKKYSEVLHQVNEYLRFKKVPKDLQDRVIMYYEQRYRRNFLNEKLILENVSNVLRRELQMFSCHTLIETVPLLRGFPEAVVEGIVARLRFEVYLPHDVIVTADTIGDSMYFIEHGTVSVVTPSGKLIAKLQDGDYFGELSLIMNERRLSTVVATSFCDVFQLMKSDFEEVMSGYPEAYEHFLDMVEQRVSEIGKLS